MKTLFLILLCSFIVSAFFTSLLRTDNIDEGCDANENDNALESILYDFFRKLKTQNPGPKYISDAFFIYSKVKKGEADATGVVVWLSDMKRNMENEEIPRDTTQIQKCIEEIKGVGV